MVADQVVSRELTSLQEELSAARRQRGAAAQEPVATPTTPIETVQSTGDEKELRDLLGQLTHEVTGLLEEAEATIAAHPTQSVLSALALGILIGRLLGRR